VALPPVPEGSGIDLADGNRAPRFHGLNEGYTCDWMCNKWGQTWPPTQPVASVFADKPAPVGEIQEHGGDFNRHRIGSAELRAMDMLNEETYQKLRLASECHRQVRSWAQSFIKPGIKLADMCELIENKNRELVGEAGLQAGIGFPTGCSLDHVAAHYTPNAGDDTRLEAHNVMKLDFGTQIDGHIIDSAFTVSFDPKWDKLLEASREGAYAGIKAAGVDVRMTDIGEVIQEVVESYEVEINGKLEPVKPIRNLSGHTITPYNIHGGVGGKSVPLVKNGDNTKMEEGEMFAIEVFTSVLGRGYVVEDMECSHYYRNPYAAHTPIRLPASRKLLGHINKTFGMLPFCRRWLERDDGGSFTANQNNGRRRVFYSESEQWQADSLPRRAQEPVRSRHPDAESAVGGHQGQLHCTV